MKRMVQLLCALFVLGPSAAAQAQTQAQSDRVDQLARYSVVSSMCSHLGFEISRDIEQRIDPAIEAEIGSWGFDHDRVRAMSRESVERASKIFATDLQFVSDHLQTDRELRNVRGVLLQYGRVCREAADDSLFRQFIKVPADFDIEAAATMASDVLLEDGGLASWQTPLTAAKGDIMMLAGACRHIIGPQKSDELVARYGRSEIVRERAYYRRSFQQGIGDPDMTAMDSIQCNRAINTYKRKIAAGGH